MELLKDKIVTIHIFVLMVVLMLAYIVGFTVSVFYMFDKLMEDKREPQVIVVHIETTKVEEVKTIQPEPPVKPTPQVAIQPKPVKKKTPTIDNNTYLLAQIINAEAKGEPYNGKVAVGNVIMNRVKHPDFPDTIKGVIFQRGQFQPVSSGAIYNKPSSEALQAAKEVINGKKVVGSQALYFYNPDISTSDWIFSRKTLTKIGNHRFAK